MSLSETSSEPSRTPKNGEKRDSLLILDEETRSQFAETISSSLDQLRNSADLDSEEDLLKARLESVNLKIEIEENSTPKSLPLPDNKLHRVDSQENSKDYKEKIKMFIEMEKLKLVSRAIQIGMPEKQVFELLDDENIPDFDLDNLKSRLQIK